jgi:hypothetical protein
MSPKRPIQLIAVDGHPLGTDPVEAVCQAHAHLSDALRHIAATLEDPSTWCGLSTELTQLQQIVRALRRDTPTLADSLMDLIIELTTLATPLKEKVVDAWDEGFRHGFNAGQTVPRKRHKKASTP